MKNIGQNPICHIRHNLLARFAEYVDAEIMPDGDCVILSFPFLDLHNDIITIFIQQVDDFFIISDDNTIIAPEWDIDAGQHTMVHKFREMFNSSSCSQENQIQYSENDGFFCKANRETVVPATMNMLSFLVKLTGIVEYVVVNGLSRKG